jgi:hypothetical protein
MRVLKKQSFILFFCILFLSVTGFYSKPFFRDFVIILEGAYRLFLGQVPYTDFFIPSTPLSYYLHIPFFYLFGPTTTSLMALGTVMSVVLAFSFRGVIKKELPFFVSLILCIGGFFCFNGKFNYPFYSLNIPYFFVTSSVFILIRGIHKKQLSNISLVGLSVCLLFAGLSKQDIGAIATVLFTFYILYFRQASVKNILIYFILPYILVLGIIGGYFIFNTAFLEHIYMGGHGKYNSLSIMPFILKAPFSLTAWFVLIATLLWKKLKDKREYLGLIIVFCSTAYISSFFTAAIQEVRAVPIVISLYLFYECSKLLMPKISLYKRQVVLVVLALILSNSGPLFIRYIVGSFAYTPFVKNTHNSLPPYTRISNEFSYKGAPILKYHQTELLKLRTLIDGHNKSFINFTEYQFLYSDYKIVPPKPLPLNFHHGLYFFDKDIPLMIQTIKKTKATLLLLQNHHPSKDPDFLEPFKTRIQKIGYEYLKEINAPTGVIWVYKSTE